MSGRAGDDTPQAPAAADRAAGALLVAAMAIGSVAMWLAAPVAWLWLGSHLTSSTQPGIGPYVLVLAGTVLSMVAIGRGLGALNRLHMRVTGRARGRRPQAAWMRSMRGERRGVDHDRGVLDGVMLLSVGLALVLFAVWFFAFAGSSLPGS